MSESSASTPVQALRAWASDWADTFDQELTEDKMSKFVGKKVKIHAVVNDEPKGGTFQIVGHSRDTVYYKLDDNEDDIETVHRSSFITEDGLGVPVFAGATVEEVDE